MDQALQAEGGQTPGWLDEEPERIHQQLDVNPPKTSQALIMQTGWIDARTTALIYSSRLPETTLVCVCVLLR